MNDIILENIQPFLLDIARECFEFINPKLNNYLEFSQKLSTITKVKENENIQYSFDIELDQIIKSKLTNLSAKVFSEESGWYETAKLPKYKVIYDPFCNSSLASKSFREAAMGISIFHNSNTWIASLILDYQTGIVGYAEQTHPTRYFQLPTSVKVNITSSDNISVKQSWGVITLENQIERIQLEKILPLLHDFGRLIISSGHIYWLKLAMGGIQVYADPIGGEPLYEMFAATVAQNAGCVVTDINGNKFDPSAMLTIFENDPNYRYYPIASLNKQLHNEIIPYFKDISLVETI